MLGQPWEEAVGQLALLQNRWGRGKQGRGWPGGQGLQADQGRASQGDVLLCGLLAALPLIGVGESNWAGLAGGKGITPCLGSSQATVGVITSCGSVLTTFWSLALYIYRLEN